MKSQGMRQFFWQGKKGQRLRSLVIYGHQRRDFLLKKLVSVIGDWVGPLLKVQPFLFWREDVPSIKLFFVVKVVVAHLPGHSASKRDLFGVPVNFRDPNVTSN